MADTTSYNNKYRKYLHDDADTYLGEPVSTGEKVIGAGLAIATVAGGGILAYKRGLLKDLVKPMIAMMGNYRRGQLVAANNALRNWSANEGLGKLGEAVKNFSRGRITDGKNSMRQFTEAVSQIQNVWNDGMVEHAQRMQQIGTSKLADKDFEIRRMIEERTARMNELRTFQLHERNIEAMQKIADDHIIASHEIDQKMQDLHLKQTGYRHATIQDLIDAKELHGQEEFIQEGKLLFEKAGKTAEDFLKKKVDENILIDEDGNLADLRDFRKTFHGTVNSLTTDFTIPFVKINPLRMFYIDHFFNNTLKPFFHVSAPGVKNPIITGHNGAQGKPLLWFGGKVYDPSVLDDKGQIQVVADNIFLVNAQKGPVARLLRNMAGVTVSRFESPAANAPFIEKARYGIQSFFDIGFQDEPLGKFDFFDMTSWGQSVMNKVTSKFDMRKYTVRDDYLSDAFGKDADFIYMRGYQKLGEADSYKGWLEQFRAGRNNMDNVTMATMFPYSFFERLNATINQVGLGLSNQQLGSAFDVFAGLVTKRILPIWLTIQAWNYVNYESDNLLGFQFSDKFADMYADTSTQLARLRDNFGITEWAKRTSLLLAGGEHIAEFPLLGQLLDWNDNEEETKDYWENGESPVRKGRWWPLGNTPFTGGKIDYWQPNWVRRVKADAEYTDSQYGSRDEYWANAAIPTLRHPLAPIRHFITDPYHYEQKQYIDRPYMVTGGIPEIENFPLIGPFLNSTIGQILKPQRPMHPEAWEANLQMVSPGAAPGSAYVMPTDQQEDKAAYLQTIADARATGGSVLNPVDPGIDHDTSQVLASYVTTTGNAKVLEVDNQGEIYRVRQILDKKSPMSTGKFHQTRMQEPPVEGMDEGGAINPMSLQNVMQNLHYNATEMGGFYGFIAQTVDGLNTTQRPVLQSSSDMNSYTRAFWDMDIGGYGGDANEIFRRFLPKDRRINEVNPIQNSMPDWLPGSEYFVDFQHGDPYTKVKKGEMRLPGEGYEKLYGIDSDKLMRMEIGASSIGYDEATIRNHLLQRDAVKDDMFQRILDFGTKWHKQWEKEVAREGVAQKMETYVKDDKTGIGGFYDVYGDSEKVLRYLLKNASDFQFYQAADKHPAVPGQERDPEQQGFYLKPVHPLQWDEDSRNKLFEWMVKQGSHSLIDPKTRSPRSYDEDGMHFENVQQVNFYAHQMDTPINYLIHVDREHPERGFKVMAFERSHALLKYTEAKVEGVRQQIRDDMASGKLHRGDLYDPIDRYRILADVAPYSQEFRDMTSTLHLMNLNEKEMNEVRRIKKQVSQRKERLRFYPYRFSTSNLENKTVTVDHVIDTNTFISKEFPDNPIRLAGLRASVAQDNPVAHKAAREVGRVVHPGARVKIAYDADELNRVKDDTYKTIKSVVYDRHGRNLNRYLLEQDLATERENDYSPAAVHARFSQKEIAFGSLWEKFSHLDTFLHTKFLQVRSPLESYERREVYGKDWQEWNDPVQDYLIPAVQNGMTHHPLYAVAAGAFIGAAFGSLKSSDVGGEKIVGRYGKIVGGVIGASVMGAAVMYRVIHDAFSDRDWVPERRKKERNTEEYFDILKYIKANKMFEEYASLAMKREHFNVKGFLAQEKIDGNMRKEFIRNLERIKQQIYRARNSQLQSILRQLEKEFGIVAKNREDAMKQINKAITTLSNHREIKKITPLAARAIQYKQAAKATLYGYEPGDPLENILAALPKKDQDYLVPFIQAPEEERKRILGIVPDYMRRILQHAWGLPVDEKPTLKEYFKHHALPGARWKGWQESTSIDDIKVKFVDRVGLDPSEFDIWEQDQQRAALVNAEVPNAFGGHETVHTFSRKIRDILDGAGLDDVNVEIMETHKPGLHLDMNFTHNRRQDFQDLLNREGRNVTGN